MKDFFDWEGPFFQLVSKIVDLVYLTLLFWLCCIPIVTAGASMSAMYYAAHKVLHHERGYLTKEFFRAFRANLKQTTLIWAGLLVFYGVVGRECYLMYEYALRGDEFGRIYVVLMVLIALVVTWNLYIFPYIARFQNSTRAILRNAVFFMMSNLGKSVMLFFLLVIFMLLVVAWPWLAVILPAVYTALLEWNMEQIFEQYMSPEDLEKERERNRKYKNK